MVPEYLIKVFISVLLAFNCSHAPSQHFSTSLEERGNVASILLQLAFSNLERPFDCLLSYQDWPLMCWTYAPWVSSEICDYYVLVAHRGECEDHSIPPVFSNRRPPYALTPLAWFFHPWPPMQKAHQIFPIPHGSCNSMECVHFLV